MNEAINYLRTIAPVEESNISSRDYNPYRRGRKYLIYNDNLYKVVKAINIGDELIEQENIVSTTIMKEIDELYARTEALWDTFHCYH